MNPSTELRDLTIQLAQAIGNGDVAVLEHHTSRHPGTAFLGTDPDERWGSEVTVAAVKRASTSSTRAAARRWKQP